MEYNNKIEKAVNSIDNNILRGNKDINDESYIHDNQLKASRKIVKSFTAHIGSSNENHARNHHVVLVAKMQSGKTGTCNGVVNILKYNNNRWANYFGIKKYLYITGMNSNGLHLQTLERLKEQVIGAKENNVVDGVKEIENKSLGEFFVQKNSDLRKNKLDLKNSLIFIDESHFGSNETNVLTKFLDDHGIDWKNKNALKEKCIYIVSISATPFDEVISDISDCKTIVELETDKAYIGVSEFLEEGCIYGADSTDFKLNKKTNSYPIIDYIKESYENITENRGVLFIRASDKNSSIIKENEFIKNNFKIVELNSKGGSINYDDVKDFTQSMIDAQVGTPTNKPIIFLIKGAYRAGVTIEQQHKNYVYMIYDLSTKHDTTAQALLGRMCGYRNNDDDWKKTKIYVNKQHAEDYAEWENDFNDDSKIPSSRNWLWESQLDIKVNLNELDYKIATKCNGNFIIELEDKEVEDFKRIAKSNANSNKNYAKEMVKLLADKHNFDFMGEAYIAGKDSYSPSTISKWFDKYSKNSYCPSYRPDKDFKNITKRVIFNKKDLGKKIIHVVLDDYKNNLIVYNGILENKYYSKNTNSLMKKHKNTQI